MNPMAAPIVFDPALVRHNLRRALAGGYADFLLRRALDDLAERLAAVVRRFPLALDVATPLPAAAHWLVQSGSCEQVVRLSAVPEEGAIAFAGEALKADEGRFDLAVSLLALQTANDLPGALIQIRRALKPDGLFVGCVLGGETLTELRQSFTQAQAEVEGGVSPRVAPFADLRDMGALLQRAGFALPVTDVDTVTVRYASPFGLMQDLRAMGMANPLADRRRVPLRRATLLRMAEIYAERFSDPDGRLRATFDILWLSGWAPDASQPKPLRPGSAKVSLKDVLGKR